MTEDKSALVATRHLIALSGTCAIVGVILLKLPIVTVTLSCAALVSLCYCLIRKISTQGDWPNAIGTAFRFPFGDLTALQESYDGHDLLQLCKKLGSPQVYRIWFGPTPALMLAHPDAVRQFWQQHDETSIVRVVQLGWSLLMIMGEGVGFKTYRNRNRISRFFHSCFGMKQVQQFDTSYESQVDTVMQQLASTVAAARGAPLDVAMQFRYLAVDGALDLFVGRRAEKYLPQLHELVDDLGVVMLATFNARYINLPGVRWLLPDTYRLRRRILAMRKKWDGVLRALLDEYEHDDSVMQESDSDSILAHYVRMTKTNSTAVVTYEELSDTMIEGFLAPSDGLAATIANTLILLALNPHAQDEARERVRDRVARASSRTVSLADLDGLDHLNHILDECQRLLPLFVFNVPEFTSCAMTLGNVTVPKNTMVMYDVQTLNRCEDIWPEPMLFRPERFQHLTERQRKALHGFGNGRSRRCLGEHFVHSFHKLLLARILLAYRVEPADDIRDIDQLPRIRRPFIYVPHVMLRFVPIEH